MTNLQGNRRPYCDLQRGRVVGAQTKNRASVDRARRFLRPGRAVKPGEFIGVFAALVLALSLEEARNREAREALQRVAPK